jgi:hypothetical protein
LGPAIPTKCGIFDAGICETNIQNANWTQNVGCFSLWCDDENQNTGKNSFIINNGTWKVGSKARKRKVFFFLGYDVGVFSVNQSMMEILKKKLAGEM